jgi:hypothetical protein
MHQMRTSVKENRCRNRQYRGVVVESASEGCGTGRALLEAMTVWLSEQGEQPVWLTTAPAIRAERLSCGWPA